MPKDFAQSYAQKSWEFYSAMHARWMRMKEQFAHHPKCVKYAQETIDMCEKKYPQLKQTKVKG